MGASAACFACGLTSNMHTCSSDNRPTTSHQSSVLNPNESIVLVLYHMHPCALTPLGRVPAFVAAAAKGDTDVMLIMLKKRGHLPGDLAAEYSAVCPCRSTGFAHQATLHA